MACKCACPLVVVLFGIATLRTVLAHPPRDIPEAYTSYRKPNDATVAFVKDPFAEHLAQRSAASTLKCV